MGQILDLFCRKNQLGFLKEKEGGSKTTRFSIQSWGECFAIIEMGKSLSVEGQGSPFGHVTLQIFMRDPGGCIVDGWLPMDLRPWREVWVEWTSGSHQHRGGIESLERRWISMATGEDRMVPTLVHGASSTERKKKVLQRRQAWGGSLREEENGARRKASARSLAARSSREMRIGQHGGRGVFLQCHRPLICSHPPLAPCVSGLLGP